MHTGEHVADEERRIVAAGRRNGGQHDRRRGADAVDRSPLFD
jgi:hypothetical protein